MKTRTVKVSDEVYAHLKKIRDVLRLRDISEAIEFLVWRAAKK